MTPFAHLPVAVPRHRAVPLRWHHRHGTSRLSTSPAGQSASNALSPIRAPNSRPPSSSGIAGATAGAPRKRNKAHEMARSVRDRHCLARQTPAGAAQCPVSRSPLAPDAFRCAWTTVPSANAHSKSGSSDNASETRRKIAPRTSRPHPPQNALDKKTVVSRGDPVVALPSADGGAMRARTASAETVPSSFMVKPALFASCALDGAC